MIASATQTTTKITQEKIPLADKAILEQKPKNFKPLNSAIKAIQGTADLSQYSKNIDLKKKIEVTTDREKKTTIDHSYTPVYHKSSMLDKVKAFFTQFINNYYYGEYTSVKNEMITQIINRIDIDSEALSSEVMNYGDFVGRTFGDEYALQKNVPQFNEFENLIKTLIPDLEDEEVEHEIDKETRTITAGMKYEAILKAFIARTDATDLTIQAQYNISDENMSKIYRVRGDIFNTPEGLKLTTNIRSEFSEEYSQLQEVYNLVKSTGSKKVNYAFMQKHAGILDILRIKN